MVFAGVDEVGRGALAGPVTVAAVVLPNNFENTVGIKDSKLLSHKKREELFGYISSVAVEYKIVSIDAETIDTINILRATMLAMQQSLDSLKIKPTAVLIDGNYSTITGYNVSTQIKADTHNVSVAAASILAKVTRDRLMMNKLHYHYEIFQWNKNKGYATREHRNAIRIYGVTPYHRLTFCKNLLQQIDNERLF